MRKRFPKSFTRVVTINGGSRDNCSAIDWERYVYKKRIIQSFNTSEFEKIDANTKGLKRGQFISEECVSSLKNFFTSLMKEYLSERFDTRFISTRMSCDDRKKAAPRTFFGLFKKEEKPVFIDGKYVFTPIEECVKQFADLSFSLGKYEMADKEYKYLLSCVKKKCDFWAGVFTEKRILCQILYKFSPISKKESRYIEDSIKELHELSTSRNKYRTLRSTCYMNCLINIQYEQGIPTSDVLKSLLRETAREFKDASKQPEIRVMYSILKVQIGRFFLYKQPRSLRKFMYNNVIVAYNILSEKEVEVEEYGLAYYMVASKYYDAMKLNSWNLIIEFVYFNLGGISYTKGNKLDSLYYYIYTLNDSRTPSGTASQISVKALAKVIKLANEAVSEKASDEVKMKA